MSIVDTVQNPVPDDFPISQTPAAVAGSQTKVLLNGSADRYYVGSGPTARYKAWQYCEQLRARLVEEYKHARETSKSSDEAIIQALYLKNSYTVEATDEEVRWAVRRAFSTLFCKVPKLVDKPWLPVAYEVDDGIVEAIFGKRSSTPSAGTQTELQVALAPLLRKYEKDIGGIT